MARPRRAPKPVVKKGKETRTRGRVAKACAQCRFGKTRCDFEPGAEKCIRCTERSIECEPLDMFSGVEKGKLPKNPGQPRKREDVVLSPESFTDSETYTAKPVNVAAKQPPANAAKQGRRISEPISDSYSESYPESYSESITEYAGLYPESYPESYPETFAESYPALGGMAMPRAQFGSSTGTASGFSGPRAASHSPPSASPGSPDSVGSLWDPHGAWESKPVTEPSPEETQFGLELDQPSTVVDHTALGPRELSSTPGYTDDLPDSVFEASTITEFPRAQSHLQNSVTHAALSAINPKLQTKLGTASLGVLHQMPPSQLPQAQPARTLISAGLISRTDADRLMGLFKSNYDHWVGLPRGDPHDIVEKLLQRCPLLVTVSCSIALRFGNYQLWQAVYPQLVRYMRAELSLTLAKPPMNIEFVQALTILAKYADSLSFDDQNFDMWTIAAWGMRQMEAMAGAYEVFSYMHMRLWNHLVLAHLCSANTTGRKALITAQGIDRCSRVFTEGEQTRFDNCMVAEVLIQWHTNRYLGHAISYQQFENEVEDWQARWGRLARLPMIQFIEPVLLFCSFLTRWTHSCRCWIAQDDHARDHASEIEARFTPYSPNSMSNSMLDASMENMLTSELLAEIGSLNAIMMSLLQLVEPRYFVCLSDGIRQIGFLSGVMALVITRIVLQRENYTRQIAKPLEVCSQLVRQLAVRFHATSRGQDVAHTQCKALIELLNSTMVSPAVVTPPSNPIV